MIDALQQVIQRAEQLEPAQQQALAEQMQQAIDSLLANARWEQLLSDPRGLDALHRLAQEAIAEYERGETEEGGFGE